jgi:RHS repeat-associated protein
VDSGGTKTYKRDGVGVTAPVISDGAASYTPGLSERRSGTSTFSHAGIKNQHEQTAANESSAATQTYDAFGNLVSSSGIWQGPFGYGGSFGYQSDGDSGLKLLGHRYYDSSTGRFLSRDKSKEGQNWFVYCKSNPIPCYDASGKNVMCALLARPPWEIVPDWRPGFPPGVDIDANIKYAAALVAVEPTPWPGFVGAPGIPGLFRGSTEWMGGIPGWVGLVRGGGKWDYKLYHVDYRVYEGAGNFNYGATGAAVGLPLEILLWAGDLVSMKDNGRRDDEHDKVMIRLGYEYYHKHFPR